MIRNTNFYQLYFNYMLVEDCYDSIKMRFYNKKRDKMNYLRKKYNIHRKEFYHGDTLNFMSFNDDEITLYMVSCLIPKLLYMRKQFKNGRRIIKRYIDDRYLVSFKKKEVEELIEFYTNLRKQRISEKKKVYMSIKDPYPEYFNHHDVLFIDGLDKEIDFAFDIYMGKEQVISKWYEYGHILESFTDCRYDFEYIKADPEHRRYRRIFFKYMKLKVMYAHKTDKEMKHYADQISIIQKMVKQ